MFRSRNKMGILNFFVFHNNKFTHQLNCVEKLYTADDSFSCCWNAHCWHWVEMKLLSVFSLQWEIQEKLFFYPLWCLFDVSILIFGECRRCANSVFSSSLCFFDRECVFLENKVKKMWYVFNKWIERTSKGSTERRRALFFHHSWENFNCFFTSCLVYLICTIYLFIIDCLPKWFLCVWIGSRRRTKNLKDLTLSQICFNYWFIQLAAVDTTNYWIYILLKYQMKVNKERITSFW